MVRTVLFVFTFLFVSLGMMGSESQRTYIKEYYSNGNLRAEGWKKDAVKMDYWIFYHMNGRIASKGHFSNNHKNGYWYFYNPDRKLIKEGHFIGGSAENWWIFYEIGTPNKSKFQYKNNRKNGYCLRYHKRSLIRAEKYLDDRKIGEWHTVSDFKHDNPDVSLR